MENYIVSARKYRPLTFDSVVGQHALTTTLKNAIAQGKLAHAYLFCGPRGVGKTTCARIFAKTINCLTPTADGEACGECESCKAFSEQRSYNVHELDAASNNSVDDIRELIEQVQIPPQVGRYKVFIIDEVHMLSAAAFNAFLKTLEEPPAHAIFILATTEKHKILPTILSRCQIYDFNRITVGDAIKHLEYVAGKEGIKYEPEALHVIAEKADGGMRDALSIFDQVASFCEGNITYSKVIEDLNVLDYDEYFAMTDTLLKGDIPSAMLRFDHILSKGFEGNYFMGGLASHFRNLLMSRDEQTLPLLDASEQIRTRYHEQAMRCEPKFIYRALKLCNNCDINYRTARNKRLLVELTLIEVAQAATGEDDTGCGLRPTSQLKPIFQTAPAETAKLASPAPVANSNAATPAATSPTTSTHQASAPVPVQPAQPPHAPAGSRVHTVSIRAHHPKTSAQPAATATHQQAQEVAAATPAEQEPFTLNELTNQWYSFANQLPREQIAVASRMKNAQLSLQENFAVNVAVENEMVMQDIRSLQTELTNYLRQHLHITETATNSTKRALNRREQLTEMLQKSPELSMLYKKLELEPIL